MAMNGGSKDHGAQLMMPMKKPTSSTRKNGSCFGDPSFASNKSLPVHRWVPWIAGFSSHFVRDILARYLPEAGVVLDPFAGVGTTLVEGVIAGHDVVGFEINPYAAFACKAKVHAYELDPQKLFDRIGEFRHFYEEKVATDYVPLSSPPEGFRTRSAFYSPAILRKVLILQDFIKNVDDPRIQDLFRLAFASTMVSYSNYSYEPSLGRRASAGKEDIVDSPVGEKVSDKLLEMAQDIEWLRGRMMGRKGTARVIDESFFRCANSLKPNSVDLIVTSPPYLNNYHYNRNTRPHLYWLEYAKKPSDLKRLEDENFGKFWQTVRGMDGMDLEFSLPDSDLEEKLQTLAGLNLHRGVYGGRGWANYAAAYFNDCRRFALGIDFALKRGGTALVVIGNSILQGVSMPTDQYFGRIAESVGLELVGIDIPRQTRTGNSIIKSDVRVVKANTSDQLYEAIVELRKPLL